ncbi:MAG: hypothetical protein ACLFPP_13645 [Spirochaetaceae bacterium]
MSSSELSIIETPEAIPRVLVLDPEGERPGELLVTAACLRRQGYEPVIGAPQPVRSGDVLLPEALVSGTVALLSLRLRLKKVGIEQILLLSGEGRGIRKRARAILPARLTRELESEEEESVLLSGFAVGAAARMKELFGEPAEEEEPPTADQKSGTLSFGIPGIPRDEAEYLLPLFDRLADSRELFEEAGIRFLLLPPVPDIVAERVRKSGLEEKVVAVGEQRSALDYYRSVTRLDGVINASSSSIYWAAACNKPLITSTKARPPKEIRTLSVYYSGSRIEELAEKVVANQMDRESLSYVRLSPHLFVDVTEASLRERCGRIRAAMAMHDD